MNDPPIPLVIEGYRTTETEPRRAPEPPHDLAIVRLGTTADGQPRGQALDRASRRRSSSSLSLKPDTSKLVAIRVGQLDLGVELAQTVEGDFRVVTG